MPSSIDVGGYLVQLARESGRALTPMELLKIAYIAHGWKLGTTGAPLTEDHAEAWQYGPVYRALYDRVKSYRSSPVEKVTGADVNALSEQDKDVIRSIFDHYSQFNGIQLSSMTHKEGTPWDLTWNSSGKNGVVSNDLIEAYYAELARPAPERSAGA